MSSVLQVFWHVTQNVDSLLTKAGCELLSELHGCSARIVCIDCGLRGLTREQLQQLIRDDNPTWTAQSNTINPDADVYLTEDQLGDFKVSAAFYPSMWPSELFDILATAMSSLLGTCEAGRDLLRRQCRSSTCGLHQGSIEQE